MKQYLHCCIFCNRYELLDEPQSSSVLYAEGGIPYICSVCERLNNSKKRKHKIILHRRIETALAKKYPRCLHPFDRHSIK